MEDLNLNPVELSANFEGNDSLLFFERIQHPVIKAQLLKLIQRYGVEKDMGKIEQEFEASLANAQNHTNINFENKGPNASTIPIGLVSSSSGQKATEKQMSIIEAHEKGHLLRPYRGTMYRNYFSAGFDAYGLEPSEEDIELCVARKKAEGKKVPEDKEEIKEQVLEYVFGGEEIAERMSQLKNYFGMRGEEVFTKDHLEYARKHYVEDVGFGGHMGLLLRAVTPAAEAEFLRLINTSGI